MKKFLVLGISGTGKTTIGMELRKRGYYVINADTEHNISAYRDLKSGTLSDMPEPPHTSEWLDQHKWVWDSTALWEAMNNHDHNEVIVCGGAYNDSEFYAWFDKIFGLYVSDPTTITRRLQAREPERWHNNTVALKTQLTRQKSELKRFNEIGAIPIDASQDIYTSADFIEDYIHREYP